MEVPTGMIADLYGRKVSRLLGVVFRILYLIILIFVDNLAMGMLAFAITAISYNLESGADSALVYDSCLADAKESGFTVIQGKREVILQSASMIGVFIGGLLADIDYDWAILLTIILFASAILMGSFFLEAPYRKAQENQTLGSHFNGVIDVMRNQKDLVKIMFLGAFFLSTITTLQFYIAIFWREQGLSLTLISIGLLVPSIGGILAGLKVQRLTRHPDVVLKLLPFMITLLLGLTIIPYLNLVALFLLGISDTLLYVSTTQWINERIESEHRATLLSVNSMAFSLVMVILFPLIGWVGDTWGLGNAFMLLSGLSLFGAFIQSAYGFKQSKLPQ
jgi:MFS family permease